MATAIEFNHVGKQYRLGLVSTGTISHDLNRWWQTSILGKEDPYLKIGSVNDRTQKADSDYVWALRDIDFKVDQGDVVGIIGKNGAGKSTLLKLLSKVTGPTVGTIRARGRIASLLEVGTGFHQEMTGRENIFMNGAILGMTKAEIASKLDEIVDFSGCERYLDTPVKRYSSGMMVRLGFAVAAHLDPEILVVDEVLAVGDAEFQKKAIGKMQDVSKGEGRTVLFVSHNMASILQLCKSGVLLETGQVKSIGNIVDVVSQYQRDSIQNMSVDLSKRKDRLGNGKIRLVSVRLENLVGETISRVKTGDTFVIHLQLKNNSWNSVDQVAECSVCIKNDVEERLFIMNDEFLGKRIKFDSKKELFDMHFKVNRLSLNKGTYYMSFYLSNQHGLVDSIQGALTLNVDAGHYFAETLLLNTGMGTYFQEYDLLL